MEELIGIHQNRRRAADARHRERQAFLKTIADSQLEQQAMAAEQAAQSEDNTATDLTPKEEKQPQSNQQKESDLKPDSSQKRRRAVDQDYFEALSQDQEDDLDDNGKV